MPATQSQPELRVYWQPGCSSCLRTKELLTRHGVPFVSIDVLADERGFKELEALGVRMVPVVAKGAEWVSGQILRDVARIAGIELNREVLPPETLRDRIDTILDGAIRFAAQLPEAHLGDMLPNRPRSFRDLASHIFQIIDAFVDETEGTKLTEEVYRRPAPPHVRSAADLAASGRAARTRFNVWWEAHKDGDFTLRADVYYGEQTRHDYMERAAWHSGQHTRQLMLALEKLGITPDRPLTGTDFAGLPMPEQVYDDEKPWD
ncbi:MAG: glutaredoxin domain-containing protein [Alphaproteobacteria bacterium]